MSRLLLPGVMSQTVEDTGGLPARDDVKRNNIFTGYTSGIQTVSASSELSSSYEAWEAVDGVEPFGSSWIGATTGLPQWWKIDFGESQAIYSIRWRARDSFIPVDYTIQSSDDGSSWTTRLEVVGNTESSWHSTDLDTPASARYWRMYVTSGANASRAELEEIEFYS